MAKFWNFVFFQVGWFACILGAAYQHELWAVIGTLAYIAIYLWRSQTPKLELTLLLKVLSFGILTDSLLMYLGILDFKGTWPSPYLSPAWMWALWLLVASTLNSSLSWLNGKPVLGMVLGAISGPLSYEAGIRMGAANWGSGSHILALGLISVVWAVAMPLFFYWVGPITRPALAKNT
ncbi:DUF2878 domain-containing protein [Polynucleobacter sp. 73C-SIWE]|uniref:DUF2878 domain-containing protein n=1 Tax=Polynucleobacter sp. 73C-SIWE TaxID=2689098 RepID=UPI001C0D7CC4|nr:DUF2878 domain-containing protein [Polynucleobacter sp. 73C-SIWE]MBU3579225.1 DUF2878 domain-containing protein [Polynucleobacter sp. 73C-SIWE]